MKDWLCRSKDFDKRLIHLETVFCRVFDEEITLNFETVEFFQVEGKFPGHILSIGGLRPDPEKVKEIREFSALRNVEQV